MVDDLRQRWFESQFIIEPKSGCWIWTGFISSSTGYGHFYDNNATARGAHRAAWQIYRGEIPAGLFVLHKCDICPCVNPDHLFLGTQRDNAIDRSQKGRNANQNLRKTHCQRGHPFDEENTVITKTQRVCRQCRNEYFRRRRAALLAKGARPRDSMSTLQRKQADVRKTLSHQSMEGNDARHS